MSWLYV
ncbi:hypothetical protein VCHC55B2_0996A, partial [Vibrio cholerae HC-55B2]